MDKKLSTYLCLFWIFLLAFIACKKDDINTGPYTPPVTPVAPVVSYPCNVKEYDLDVTIVDTYNFFDNYHNPWEDPGYYDITSIHGKGNISSLGEFIISIEEYADTAALSDSIVWSGIYIYQGTDNRKYIIGSNSANFKKLIRLGGGSFEGSYKITSGSAQTCDRNVFDNLAALSVSGTLDVASKTVSITIKGKAYF
jgi:hypothetical protein